MARRPKQQDLPEMSDRKLDDLHEAAEQYAGARDNRIHASGEEVEAKDSLLALMHKHKMKHYAFENVVIDIVPEGEKLKVRIKKMEAESEAA